MDKRVTLICDLQFGSTGKGLIAGYIAERDAPDTIVTAWGSNSGHTYIDGNGRKFVHTMLGNGIVSPCLNKVMIGPGSLINPDNLIKEIGQCEDVIAGADIMIHPHAAVITDKHVDIENNTMTGIGSTKKGVGAALIQKIQRDPKDMNTAVKMLDNSPLGQFVVSSEQYNAALDSSHNILIEGAQGFSLGINSGFYPYVTSRECTPAQIATDSGVPIGWLTNIIGCMRTFPIRVANRYDEDGKQIGWSGPHYSDQKEITFESIGVEPELTTVTQLPRRVFTFSKKQTKEAMRMCRPTEIFVNFMNYIDDPDSREELIRDINGQCRKQGGNGVVYLGYGPTVNDIREQK